MASERVQRQIDRLLDEAEEAAAQRNWNIVRERAEHVLTFDPQNADALAFLGAAERGLEPGSTPTAEEGPGLAQPESVSTPAQPISFADGRYQVRKFLGEGGKKRVYLAHDGVLDRDVAFALIKTEGWTKPPGPVSPAKLRPWAG